MPKKSEQNQCAHLRKKNEFFFAACREMHSTKGGKNGKKKKEK